MMTTLKKVLAKLYAWVAECYVLLCSICFVYLFAWCSTNLILCPIDISKAVDPEYLPEIVHDGNFRFVRVGMGGTVGFNGNVIHLVYAFSIYYAVNLAGFIYWVFGKTIEHLWLISLQFMDWQAFPDLFFSFDWVISLYETYFTSFCSIMGALITIILAYWVEPLLKYTYFLDIYVVLIDPNTYLDIIGLVFDVIFVFKANAMFNIVYPIGLLLISVLFLIKNNISYFKSFFNTYEKIFALFVKWYEHNSVINILLCYNLFFLMLGIYHIHSKTYFLNLVLNTSKENTFTYDMFSFLSTLFVIMFFLIFIFLARFVLKNIVKPEIIFFISTSVALIVLLVQISNLFLVYLGITIISLTLYPLIVLDKNCEGQTEASVKYFFMSSLASSIMLYGIALIFKEFNSLDYLNLNYLSKTCGEIKMTYTIAIGFIFVTFGFFFKLSLVPLQNWTPDVYLGAPTAVTCFLATIIKFGVYCSFIRFYYSVLLNFFYYNEFFKNLMIIFSISSIIVGAWGAIDQFKIKRFIGFTTINQMGFVLLGLTLQTFFGFAASYIYICIYTILNLIFFSFLVNIKISTTKESRELVYLSDLIPFFNNDRGSAFTFIFLIFSLAGMPPTIGFYMKLLILKSLVFSGYKLLAMFILYINMISILYYFRIIKLMFFDADNLIYTRSKENTIKRLKDRAELFIVDFTLNIFFNNNKGRIFYVKEVLEDLNLFKRTAVLSALYIVYNLLIWLFISGIWLSFFTPQTISYYLLTMWADLNLQELIEGPNAAEIELTTQFLKLY